MMCCNDTVAECKHELSDTGSLTSPRPPALQPSCGEHGESQDTRGLLLGSTNLNDNGANPSPDTQHGSVVLL
jgi:hypothetical protein